MTITGGTALGKDEIDRMQREAEQFAAEDHARREAAEARNNADQLSYQVDKALEDYGDKVPAEEREAVQKANAEVKEALKGDDIALIKSATEALMQAFQRIGQAMYSQQPAAEGESPGGDEAAGPGSESGSNEPSGSTGDDDVVEGEIVDEGSG
jgi:molecular chaperone DnaK